MINKRLFFGFLFISLLITSCENLPSRQSFKHTQTKIVLDDCKCKQYCYGEIYDTACLIDKTSHPQNCIDLVGTKTAKGVYGGEDQYFTEETKKSCFESLISKQNSIELCPLFPDVFQYKCFASVGKKSLEPKHCKDIPYSYKSECYLYISKNKTDFSLALCDELNREDKIMCYANRATVHSDSSICLKLGEEIDKINCYSQINEHFDPNFGNTNYVPIYFDWFVKTKFDSSLINKSYCVFESPIGEDNTITRNHSCYMSLAMYHKRLDECYELPQDYRGINIIRKCLFYTALWNNFDIKECDKFGIDFKECKDGVALSKRDINFCKEVYTTERDKSDCIYKIATDYFGAYKIKNILFCKEAGSYKRDCISAIYKEDNEQFLKKEVCELLSESNDFLGFSAKCYHKFALKNLDSDSCEKIDDGFSQLKSDCKERVQNAIKNS
mgnify:CR=1 FL=1